MKSLFCTLAILCSVSALATTESQQVQNAINALESNKADAIETAVTTLYKAAGTLNDKDSQEAMKYNVNAFASKVNKLKFDAENNREAAKQEDIKAINALLAKYENHTALGYPVGQKLVEYIRNSAYAKFLSTPTVVAGANSKAKQAAQNRIIVQQTAEALVKFDNINKAIANIDAKAGN
ncbi:MAG: hypothetical protein JST80_07470 [Bdellovibrionales bacterium]|nr:hypothetical protein [Bdellovibrionales bacterium]